MDKLALSINYGYGLDADTRFRLIKDSGFGAVSLWWGRETRGFGISRMQQFELVDRYQFDIDYVHAPFNFHSYIGCREKQSEGMTKHRRWLELCSDNRATKLVIHVNRLTKDEYVNGCLIDSLNRLGEYGKSLGVKLVVENTGRPLDLKKLFDNVPSIGFCLDTSHANLTGDKDGALLDLLGDRLSCLHLSDNEGEKDRHWIPGEGSFGFGRLNDRLIELGYEGYIGAEVLAGGNIEPDKFLALLRDRLSMYFPSYAR